MRLWWKALSAASVVTVILLALGLLLFTPGAAIAVPSGLAGWHPDSGDRAALARTYDGNRIAMETAGAPYAQWQGRQFLSFHPRGDGRIVEVFGDLVGAERTTVLVWAKSAASSAASPAARATSSDGLRILRKSSWIEGLSSITRMRRFSGTEFKGLGFMSAVGEMRSEARG